MGNEGIIDPWAKEEKPEEEEDLFLDSKYTLNRVFEGRCYKIIVRTPVAVRNEPQEVVNQRANKIFGITLTGLMNNKYFIKILAQQQIFDKDMPIVNKRMYNFGKLNLWATMSCLDESLVNKMLVDRLVLALRELCNIDKIAKATLEKAGVSTVNVQL